ncbi:MAG: ABC transporter substrate-binding protein [Chloroflexi bacterium]|nr:ABC transporter substrate-binding protein [Chloroflexota bacterium]
MPFSTPPRRVVSLVPSVTESLFDLGMGDRLVGRTDYCVHPNGRVERVPAVGGTKNPDLDAIRALQPDLIIANQEENRPQDVDALRADGLTVWVTFPRTVRDAFNLLWTIMYGFEQPEHSEAVRQIERLADWLELMERPQPCRVFVPIWHDPWMTFNRDTFAHDLLRLCGGWNVFADRERRYPLEADLGQLEAYAADDPRAAGRDTRYPRVTLAEIEASQPDVILLPSEPFAFGEKHLALFSSLNVPAVHNGQVRLVDGSLLTWHGTRLARALTTVPDLLCPFQSDL